MNPIYNEEQLYLGFECLVEEASNDNFFLHLHNDYEIFMFLGGDSKYVVEGNVYNLEPNDIIVIKKYQMHRIFHNNSSNYRRLIFMIKPDFFHVNDCPEYEKAFLDLSDKAGNKIDAETVKSSGLYDAIMRYKNYSNNFSDQYSPVALSAITEILYLINNIKLNPTKDSAAPQLKEILSYINNNFTKNITLDELENQFFISKYHLCHVFPKATGLTVHQYITKKRLIYARELISSGKTISESAQLAGFNTYSSFYRAYSNEYNQPPKK